jgi:S-adenosylmethionine decarboxylase
MAKTLGLHIIADLYGVNPDLIDRVEDIRHLLENSVKAENLQKSPLIFTSLTLTELRELSC